MGLFSRSSHKDESSSRYGKFGIPRRKQKETPGDDEVHPEAASQDNWQTIMDNKRVERTGGNSRPLTANPVAGSSSGTRNTPPPLPPDNSTFDRRVKERSQSNATSQASKLLIKRVDEDITSSSSTNTIPKTEEEAYIHIEKIRSQKRVLDGDSNAIDLDGALELYVDGIPRHPSFNTG